MQLRLGAEGTANRCWACRLRAEVQRAVLAHGCSYKVLFRFSLQLVPLQLPCRYKDATTFRDLLADLEQESKRLSALSAEWSFKAQPQLRLGQRVLHRSQGYR